MERIIRVLVAPRPGEHAPGYLLSDIKSLGIDGVTCVERCPLYFIRGRLDDSQVALLCTELLADPIVQTYQAGPWDTVPSPEPGVHRVEVGLLPGVTDTVAANLLQRAHLLGVDGLVAASTASSYLVYGDVPESSLHVIAQRLLSNSVIQYYALGALKPHIGTAQPAAEIRVGHIALSGLNDAELLELSRQRLLSLDLAEMHAVQAYFRSEGREPTDVELESIAQTWSEHCVHKTFKGIVEYAETTPDGTTHITVDSLLKTFLQAATLKINAPWVLSAFVDNAGIIAFDEHLEASFKV